MATAIMKQKEVPEMDDVEEIISKISEESPYKRRPTQKRTWMTVPEMGKLLGLKKTDRYWLVHKNVFESKEIAGKIRINIASFEKWYANQIKYHKVTGEEPGKKLKSWSYSVKEVADLLGVDEYLVYDLLKKNQMEAVIVDYWKRIPKESFQNWYKSQSRYRTKEDREKDALLEDATITMPEMAQLLGTTRSSVYTILDNPKYSHFFESLKEISDINDIINWQEISEMEEAKKFFSHINILPNMPPMQSILNSVRLGYAEEELSMQGLGYRNLVLLFVLINSLLGKKTDTALNVLTIEEPEAHLCINNVRLMVSFLKAFTNKNKKIQLFYSTHSTEFINKMNLKNVVVLHNGKAYSFVDELDEEDFAYLAKNPNLDLFKLFFSNKCILFEGISEELLIRSYLDSQEKLSDIEVLSFHKGFEKIMNIWKKINEGSCNKLGIIRDYDNQPNAKEQHNKYNDDKEICVRTTEYYTLEPEIVNTGNNFKLLKKKYGDVFGWSNMTLEELTEAWKNAKASDMFTICKDLAVGELEGFQMPKHIQEVIDFLS